MSPDPSSDDISLINCGAHLSEMSTSECHRVEVYELASTKTDSEACKRKAQEDLITLMALCNRPTAALICNMTSKRKQVEAGRYATDTQQVCKT